LFQIPYFLLQLCIVLFKLTYLVRRLQHIGIQRLGVSRLDFLGILADVVEGHRGWRLQPALLGRGRQGAIAVAGCAALSPQLVPHKAQEERAQGFRAQSSGIVRGAVFDQAVVLEGFGDAGKVVLVEAELGDAAEQEDGLERRVWCRRRIHAPDSAARGTERTAAALDKMNRRHDLRVHARSATVPLPVPCAMCHAHAPCASVRVVSTRQPRTGSRAPRSYQFGDARVSLLMNGGRLMARDSRLWPSDCARW
jgi:hypothetical protein